MNIIFRNKLNNYKINIQDFYNKNNDGKTIRKNIKVITPVENTSLVSTTTYKFKEWSLEDILLSEEWEIWSDHFWINEKQICDLELILYELFKSDDPQVLKIANTLGEFLKYNKMMNNKGIINNE